MGQISRERGKWQTDNSRGSADDLINRCSQCEEAAVKVTVGAKAHWAKRHHIPPHLRLSQQGEAGCSHHLYTLTPAALLSFPPTEPFPTLITTPLPSKGAVTVSSNQNTQKSLKAGSYNKGPNQTQLGLYIWEIRRKLCFFGSTSNLKSRKLRRIEIHQP